MEPASAVNVKSLVNGTPGRRFAVLHRARRRRNAVRKAAAIAGGSGLILLGLLLMATPGPGLLATLLGAGLVASESPAFARALDRLELRVRAMIGK